MELIYDLKQCIDPVTRLGIHGLHRLLKAAEKYPDRYPGIQQTENLSWVSDSDSIRITFTNPGHLRMLMVEAYSAMPRGVVLLPGYESNPTSKGFYVTARTHYAVTQLFAGGAKGARRTGSLNPGKVTPEFETLLKGLDPERLEFLDGKKVPLGDFHAKATFTPNYPYPGVFSALADKIIKGWEKPGFKVEVSALVHPKYTVWNNDYTPVPVKDAFALYFTPLAYVYSHCTEGPFGVGIDAPTFDEGDQYHKDHIQNAREGRGESVIGGTVTYIHAGTHVAARALLASLDCPENRTYSVVSEMGSFDFYFQGAGTGMYAAFNKALKDILGSDEQPEATEDKAEDIQDGFRVLRKIPLTQLGESKIVSVYDQVDANLQVGGRWFFGLGKMASLKRDGITGLLPWEKKTMGVLVNKMSTETERTIMEYGYTLKKALAGAYKDQGRANAFSDAEVDFVRVYMARAMYKPTILSALGKIHRDVVNVTWNWKPDLASFQVVQEQLNVDPRAVKDLLILGATLNFPEKDTTEGA